MRRCSLGSKVSKSLACTTCVVDHDAHVTHALRNQPWSTPDIATIHSHDKEKAESAEIPGVGLSLVKAGKPVSLSYQYRLNTG